MYVVAEPPELSGPHAPIIVSKTSDRCARVLNDSKSLSGVLGKTRIIHVLTHTGSTWSYHNITTFVTKITYIRVRKIYNLIYNI